MNELTRIEDEPRTLANYFSIPGTRPSGICFTRCDLDPAFKPVDGMADIPKTINEPQALKLARAMSHRRVRSVIIGPKFYLEVTFPPLERFRGNSWYLALKALHIFLSKGAVYRAPVMDI